MKIVQSYLSTIVRHDFSLVEMRILFHIVRRCRILTYGQRLDNLVKNQIDTSHLNLDFTLKIKDLMGKSHNYTAIYRALAHLQDSTKIEWYCKESKTWNRSYWVNNISYSPNKGILQFSSPRWLVDYICDCRKFGYREYDFELAMSLSNPNAARLYLLTCSITKPWTVAIPGIKEILGIKGYNNFSSFERRVLVPAMKELEKRNMNGFTYKVNRENGSKYSHPDSIVFIPIKREKSITDTQSRVDAQRNISRELSFYLLQNCGFTDNEILANSATLKSFSRLDNWQNKLIDIVDRSRRKNKNKGYIINAMKSEILAFESQRGLTDIVK